MMFFTKVSSWDRWTASPKHPQSISGLNMTRIKVISVNTDCRPKVIGVMSFLHTPVMRPVPNIASIKANADPIGFATGSRKPICMKSRYSLMMRPVPTGSISFRIPDMKNTMPVENPQKRFIRCSRYLILMNFIYLYFIAESTTSLTFAKISPGGSILPSSSEQSMRMNLGSSSHCFLYMSRTLFWNSMSAS